MGVCVYMLGTGCRVTVGIKGTSSLYGKCRICRIQGGEEEEVVLSDFE